MTKLLKYFNIVIYTFIFFQLVYIVSPAKYRQILMVEYLTYRSQMLDDYDRKTQLESAKCSVIDKVIENPTILNKNHLIEKIENVSVKIHQKDQNIWLGYEHPKMTYFYNAKRDLDFIIVNDGASILEYYTFVHELNHLVDQHKVSSYDVDVADIIVDVSKLYYISYFSEFPDIYDAPSGIIFYDLFNENRDYYLKRSEVYARLSGLKNVLIQVGIVEIDETIEYRHVSELLTGFKNPEMTEDMYLTIVDSWDFLPLLPMINWERKDILAIL